MTRGAAGEGRASIAAIAVTVLVGAWTVLVTAALPALAWVAEQLLLYEEIARPAWLWPLAQTRRKAARTFSNVLRLMDDDPDFRFSQSQPQLYAYVAEDHPGLMEDVRRRVAEGRWEPLGGMWIEADCNLTGAESLVRQFMLGERYFREQFGRPGAPILWLPDVFGYAWQLPQLVRQAGLKYFVTAKMSWNQYNRLPYDAFDWVGLDGSSVPTYLITTSKPGWWGATYSADLTPAEIFATWQGARQPELHDEMLVAFGHGDGGGGPTARMLEDARTLDAFPSAPRVRLTTAEDFLDRLVAKAAGRLPEWNGAAQRCRKPTESSPNTQALPRPGLWACRLNEGGGEKFPRVAQKGGKYTE